MTRYSDSADPMILLAILCQPHAAVIICFGL
jgi:hypothetical protein